MCYTLSFVFPGLRLCDLGGTPGILLRAVHVVPGNVPTCRELLSLFGGGKLTSFSHRVMSPPLPCLCKFGIGFRWVSVFVSAN